MSVTYHADTCDECRDDSASLADRLAEVLAEVDRRIDEVRMEERWEEVYNYLMVRSIVKDVKHELSRRGEVSPLTSFILPGAIYIAKALAEGAMTVDGAAAVVRSVRSRVRKFLKILAYEKNLELLVPTDVDVRSLEVYGWVDHAGKDKEGNDQFVLTLYFSFPFDIHRYDGRTEYEPVSFLFVKRGDRYVPVKAFARVHYDIYSYDIEGVDKVRILFARYGHTPIVLDGRATPLSTASAKTLLDKLWIRVGPWITEALGIRSVELKTLKENVHLYTSYKLKSSESNPFLSKVHPYFVCMKIKNQRTQHPK